MDALPTLRHHKDLLPDGMIFRVSQSTRRKRLLLRVRWKHTIYVCFAGASVYLGLRTMLLCTAVLKRVEAWSANSPAVFNAIDSSILNSMVLLILNRFLFPTVLIKDLSPQYLVCTTVLNYFHLHWFCRLKAIIQASVCKYSSSILNVRWIYFKKFFPVSIGKQNSSRKSVNEILIHS